MKARGLTTLALAGALLLPATAAAQDESGTGVDCSAFSAGAVVHFMGPYTQQLLDGAQAAADECGASITTAGPPAFELAAAGRTVPGHRQRWRRCRGRRGLPR